MRTFCRIFALLAAVLPLFACSGTIDKDDTGNPGDDTGNKPSVELSSGYRQQMVAMQFTSVGCVNCPFLAEAIKDVGKNFPGKTIPVAFHLDYGDEMKDPMSISMNEKFYARISYSGRDVLSLPMFAFNFRKSSQPIVNEYAKIVSELELEGKNNPPVCGIAIETSYDAAARKASIKAKFKSDVAKDYRYHIFLVEDGIEYMQMGSENGSYVHDNVLRHIFSDNVFGTKLEKGVVLEPGKEYVVEKSLVLDEGWKADDISVVAAMLCASDGDSAYYGNNANVCGLGKSVDYLYEK